MDLACYDREYAPREQRDLARAAHLAAWPQAADAALSALDAVTAPVARALVGPARGLAAGIPAGTGVQAADAARAASARLVGHLEQAAGTGDPDAALGGPALSALMSSAEGLVERADAERDRLTERLAESCALVDPGRPALQVARELVREHPDADGVLAAARIWTSRAIDFTTKAGLLPYNDGDCLVLLAPESRRWAMAMMSAAAPGEPDAPSRYYIAPARTVAGQRSRGVARGVQRHDAARHHGARGRARTFLARPGHPAGSDRRQAHPALRRVR
jgi:hypothetical protein